MILSGVVRGIGLGVIAVLAWLLTASRRAVPTPPPTAPSTLDTIGVS
jgi:hypothetical protein